jgi:hypothetical protein
MIPLIAAGCENDPGRAIQLQSFRPELTVAVDFRITRKTGLYWRLDIIFSRRGAENAKE